MRNVRNGGPPLPFSMSLAIRWAACGASFFACLAGSVGRAEDAAAEFHKTVLPVLSTYCLSCHSGATPKADLSLDRLGPKVDEESEVWRSIVDRLAADSMPPKGKPRPTDAEREAVIVWASAGIRQFEAASVTAMGRARMRRLSRVEYANTLRDLLGAEVDIAQLPEDGVVSGFDNVDAALDLSSTLLERYLEIADAALDAVFVSDERPVTETKHFEFASLARQMTRTKRPMRRYGESTLIRENDVVFLSAAMASKPLLELKATTAGLYRFRISANSLNHSGPMTLMIYAGNYGMGVQGLMTRVIGAHDVVDQPTTIEFTARMGAKEAISIVPYGVPKLYGPLVDGYQGPGLAVQWVEVEGPIIDVWPPVPATRLLGDIDLAKGSAADFERILRDFATRAFRRPTTVDELAPYVELSTSRMQKGYSFEAALRVGLVGVLCSPDFLYLSFRPGQLDDYDLASRLSYFLWSTMPDDTLQDLAARGELGERNVLAAQIERMLADRRAQNFIENFTGQWLSLRNLEATIPDKKLYPDYDELLLFSMPRETQRFFEEVLKNDLSVLEFIDSDWSMLNGRLATLYEIDGVEGSEFRKVQLPADSHRGGVMTQAAVLKVTANGTNTSPVVRGVWVLDHILGTPPPPPPKDVPAIEPDVRGAKTIREQLAKHRQIQRCANCHAMIDPCGNALENFDVIGGWREWYRVVPGGGSPNVKLTSAGGGTKGVGRGPDVDAADELADGRKFVDIGGFKKHLLENPEQVASALAEKLLVYATGHKLEFSDREAVMQILSTTHAKHYGLRSLIHAIVQGPTFRNK